MSHTWQRFRAWLDNFFDTRPPGGGDGSAGVEDGVESSTSEAPGDGGGDPAQATDVEAERFLSDLFARLRLRKRKDVAEALRPTAAVSAFFSMFAMLFLFVATLSAQGPLRTFLLEISPEVTEAVAGLVPDFLILIFGVASAITAYRLGAQWRGRGLRGFLRAAARGRLVRPEVVEDYLREQFEVEWKP